MTIPMLERIITYKNRDPDPIIQEYVAYIQDTNTPLEDRWTVFCEAPYEWKEHFSSVVHFEFEDAFSDFNWYDNRYVDRYQTVDLANEVEFIQDDIAAQEDGFDRNTWTQELLDSWKEEILQQNLGSFVFDW